jgi:hypothetical protein
MYEKLGEFSKSNMKRVKQTGLKKYAPGGNPGDKYYRYQNTQYKKDQQGNWHKWNGKSWSPTGGGSRAYDGENYIYLEDFLQRGSMQADDSNWGNDKPKATVSNYEIQRNQTLNSPFATTTQKIKATNAPLASNVKIQKDLYAQKEKEDKRKELEKLEEQRQKHLRTVGSDNTRVDNSIITNNSLGDIPNVFEQMESVTKAQKDAARAIVNKGDFAQHFPDLYKEYLSEENSNREGGPLTMEEIALREMRSNPDFFSTLESRKEAAWKKREQKAYDNLAWYDKALNYGQSFIADPLMVLNNQILRGERPLVGQGEWSIDPEDMSAEDNYYYDKATGKSQSTLNNLFNYINIGRAGAGAGESLREGDYGDAVYDLASAIPMIKGAKYGLKGMNALMKMSPASVAPSIFSGTSALSNITAGQALVGYGGYHGLTHNLPNAYNAYSSGDWKKGNEELFMGLVNATPLVLEARAANAIPKTIQATKGLYNDVATGNSILPVAWRSPAAGLNSEKSSEMFNQILNSSEFTNAEKALVREYQYSSFPFTKTGAKQNEFNALIQKASAKFPENAVLTRKFYGESPEGAFQSVKGEPGKYTEFSIQDRPSAFSAGKGSDANWGADRVVMGGRNLKKVEGNFVKNTYEPVPEEYYANLSDDALTVMDDSKRVKDSYSFNEKVGDNYYGTSRLTPEEIQAQAEALYQKRVADFNSPENSRFMKPGKVEEYAGKSKDGSADNLYTQEEAEAIVAKQTETYNQRQELYGNPANKDKAIEAIMKESEGSFSSNPRVSDERELMGSGFDMKVVGRVKNELGGTDYIVQPRNIRSLKSPDNKALNSVSQGNTNATGLSADANVGKQTSSNLEISQKFDDAENFSKERMSLDIDEKRRLLREEPDKVLTKYKDIWSNDDAMADHHDLFPFTREGQQQAFDEGTSFAKKWMFKDSDKFDELNAAYKAGNDELIQLDMKRATLENALNREMNLNIDPEIRQKAITEFLKRDPNRQAFDVKTKNGYDSEFVKILVEQNPNDVQFKRIGNILKQIETSNQRFGELQPEVYDNLRMINENIDPQFRNKVAQIYDRSLNQNEMMPNLDFSQAEIHMGNLDDQAKLVQFGKYEPSYKNLDLSDQKYIEENLFKMEGVNRSGDSSIEGNIITLGSRPQRFEDQLFYKIVSKSDDLGKDPQYVRFVGSFMKDPLEVATTNVHEVAGHQGQKMFGNWINKIQEYDPELMYDVPMEKNNLAKIFKEALVEPVKGVKSVDDKGAIETFRTHDTWLSSPQEIYSDLMIARYDLAKRLMKTYEIDMDAAIANIKDPVNQDYYAEWFAEHPEVVKHFKGKAPMDLKKQVIKYLPAVVIGGGYGLSQGMNSDTPQNKYGGNIKNLSKFIRK